jgi:CubicO group peptidase (beta-lactamase class C family)
MALVLRPAAIAVAALLSAASFTTIPAFAFDTKTVAPADVALSADRLDRLSQWLKGEIGAKKIPGAVLLVARHGKTAYFEAFGTQDPTTGTAMAKDSLFRIYSMTKPITTVAAMMLVEEGKLTLETPLSALIPSFKEMKVAVEKAGTGSEPPQVELIPAARGITVHDLMRHTSGLTYGFFGDSAAKRAYKEAKIDAGTISNAEFADSVAKMPLGYQPGSAWDYSYSTDVLGRVVEVVSGKPLGEFFKERIFDPLGMTDTGFYVTDAAKHPRIAEPLADDRLIGNIEMSDPRMKQAAEPGGQGLVSTATDYARFLQMLLNNGEMDGKRYLSPETIAFMASDHLGPSVERTKLYLPGPGYSFGLGFAVRMAEGLAPIPSNPGEYYWGGAAGTYFWVDPKADMFVVFMMQSPKQRQPYRSVLRNIIYGAVEK